MKCCWYQIQPFLFCFPLSKVAHIQSLKRQRSAIYEKALLLYNPYSTDCLWQGHYPLGDAGVWTARTNTFLTVPMSFVQHLLCSVSIFPVTLLQQVFSSKNVLASAFSWALIQHSTWALVTFKDACDHTENKRTAAASPQTGTVGFWKSLIRF